jgi:hypothetical protein
MTHEYHVVQIFPRDLVDHVIDLRRQRDGIAGKMGTFPNSGERRRDDIVAVRGQLIGNAPPAPSAMPRTVDQHERSAVGRLVAA